MFGISSGNDISLGSLRATSRYIIARPSNQSETLRLISADGFISSDLKKHSLENFDPF